MDNLLPSESKQCITQTALEFRKARNMSQKKLGEKMGYSQSHVSKTENGDRNLQVDDLRHYSPALGITPEEFIAQVAEKWRASARQRRKAGGAGPRRY
jgi:transcriptional regulator with XRE-family HTH domain